jgi:hypothetical protein
MQPRFEVADVLRKLGTRIEDLGLNTCQLRTLYSIKKCRTAELGGHIDACDNCGNLTISYNSCQFRISTWFSPCPTTLTLWRYISPK